MWIVFALLAALSAAIVVVLSKAGMKNIDSSLVFAIEGVLVFIVSWCFVLLQGKTSEISKIDKRTWLYILIAGVVTTLSSLLSFKALKLGFKALKLGDAASVSPVQQLTLVFSIVFAVIFLKERISWQIVTGAVLMVAGAVIIATAKKVS